VYSLASRIRLVSDDAVVREAEAAIKALLDLYRAPNLSIEKLREMSPAELQDPLRPFSEACRQELQSLTVQVPL
jgi:hypothetical protein